MLLNPRRRKARSKLLIQWISQSASTQESLPLPRLHPNQTIAILAGGPSLTQQQANQVQHLVTIAINDSYQLAPWADYHYFCDSKWQKWHCDREDYQSFQGVRITQDVVDEPGVIRIAGKHDKGVSESPEVIHYGSNSGFQALNIAYLMGASRILLLGYDMKVAKNGKAHWFGDHPDKVRSSYLGWLSNFSVAADQLKGKVEVINCSPDSALQCFPKMALTDALKV